MMARRVGTEEGVAWWRTRLGCEGRVAVQWWVKSFGALGVWEAIAGGLFEGKEKGKRVGFEVWLGVMGWT